MFRVAENDPVVLGVKVKLIVQLAPGASEAPQLLDCANLLALPPVIARLEMCRVAPPVFSRATLCSALVVSIVTDPNETTVTETPAAGRLSAPENATVAEAEISATAVRAARRIPAFGLA